MRQLLHILLSVILLSSIGINVTGCIDDDYTTEASATLSFSTDTLSFDTIFTDLKTPTASFRVINHNKKMVNISHIKVVGASGNATFRLNVDGINDTEFSNIDIRSGDSIFIFVQALINTNNDDAPLRVEDKIKFLTNGVEQEVVLLAWGQDVERLRNHTINENTTFTADKPYVIFDTLTIQPQATLTVLPGAMIYLHDKATIMVHGSLQALGKQGNEITLRGDRTDKVVGGIDFDIMSGQWNGIFFQPTSFNNILNYVNIRACSTGIEIDSCGIEEKKLSIFNSIIHNSSGNILTSRHSYIEAIGTEFSDASASVADIIGGKARFINCTFANQYLFSAITGSIVNIGYSDPKNYDGITPLADVEITNCIIHGNTSDITPGVLDNMQIFVRNTLLRSEGEDDSNFINCKWNGDPKFYTIRNDYYFDYRLQDDSEAIGIANIEVIPDIALYDRYGNYRLRKLPDGSINADAGAYTWMNAPKNDETNDFYKNK